MRGKFLLFSLFLAFVALAPAQASENRAVDCTQLTAWLMGSVTSARLRQLVQQRGVNFIPAEDCRDALRAAGAESDLMRELTRLQHSAPPTTQCISKELLDAAQAIESKNPSRAEHSLRALVRGDSGNAALHFALGEVLRFEQQWEDAFDEFSESSRLMPDFPETHSRLAFVFYHWQDGENTIAEARTALSLDPDNAEGYKVLGLGLTLTGQYEAALRVFEESLHRAPHDADLYYDMAITLQEKGDLGGSADAYRKALKLKPDSWQAHTNLGMVLYSQHKVDEAILEYKQAKRLAPEQPAARNNLGRAYCDKGEYEAAIAEFRELFRIDPNWGGGHSCLAKALMAQHDYEGAIEELRLAVQQDPTSAAEHRILGQALLLKHENKEAIRELEIALTLNPDSARTHHYLGMALESIEDWAGAEKQYRAAIAFQPSADNHYYLALLLIHRGNYDEALKELETAARLDPEQSLYRARQEQLIKQMKPDMP